MTLKIKFITLLSCLLASVAMGQSGKSFFVSVSAGDFRPFVNSTSFEEFDARDNLAFGGEIGFQWNNKFRVVLKTQYFSRKGYPLTFTSDYGPWEYVRDGTAFFRQWIYSLNFGAAFWEGTHFRFSSLTGMCFMLVKRKHERTEDLHYRSYYDATGTKKELGLIYSISVEMKLKNKKVFPFIEISATLNKFFPTLFMFEEFGGVALVGGVRYFFRAPK